jgi:hypothetical protein
MTTTAPSLPTAFDPPSSCFAEIYWSQASSTYGNFYLGDPNDISACLPSATLYSTVDYFSGSYCPNGWTTACDSTSFGLYTQSIVTCCPPGAYTCQSTPDAWGCQSTFGNPSSILATVIPTNGPRYPQTYYVSNSGAVAAPSVQLRWDFGSSPTLTPGDDAGNSSSTGTDSTEPWKIALGVVLGVVLLLAVVLGAWLHQRRRRPSSREGAADEIKPHQKVTPNTGTNDVIPLSTTEYGGLAGKYELSCQVREIPATELEGIGVPRPSELQATEGTNKVVELPTDSR